LSMIQFFKILRAIIQLLVYGIWAYKIQYFPVSFTQNLPNGVKISSQICVKTTNLYLMTSV